MIKAILFSGVLMVSLGVEAQTQVYMEDFDNGLPVNYTIVDNDGLTPHASVSDFSDAWIGLADPDNPTDTIVGSTSYFDPAGQADRWLITPAITLGAYGNTLSWEAKSHDASFPDDYMVLASQTDTQLSSFTDTLLHVTDELDQWTLREVNVSDSGLNNVTVHFAFVNRTYDGFKLYLDSISVISDDPAGLNENKTVSMSLYPNPATDKVYFGTTVTSVSLYSMNGLRVKTEQQVQSINVSDLNIGVYLVIIENKGIVYREKLIIR